MRLQPAQTTVREELANTLTHSVGIVLSIAAMVMLCSFAKLRGDTWHVVSCAVFGASLVLMYTVSTLYHGIDHPGVKPLLRTLDHSAIFILIAGTLTPFALVTLRGPWGWSIFGLVWGVAVCGIVGKAVLGPRDTTRSLVVYVAAPWLLILVAGPLWLTIEPAGLMLLLGGGLAYTLGIVFFVWRKLPYNHAIWHGFVLAGSTCHVFAVLVTVIPAAS